MKMLSIVWTICLFHALTYCLIHETKGERVLSQETEAFDFDGLPGSSHEFKIRIDAGYQECFFQKLEQGNRLHVSFEVLSGGDRTLDMVVTSPHRQQFVGKVEGRQMGGLEPNIIESGPYAICLDNRASTFHSKLVYVYIVVQVDEEYDTYRQEIDAFDFTVSNISTTLKAVSNAVLQTFTIMAKGRMHLVKDWYTVANNNVYVQRFSAVQCVVIVLSSITQVFVLRRLFKVTTVTPTTKPRA